MFGVVLVAGCSDGAAPQLPAFLGAGSAAKTAPPDDFKTQALIKTQLAQSGVILRGPDGYCIDKTSVTRNTGVLISCAAFNPLAQVVPTDIGALRLTVGRAGAGATPLNIPAMEAFVLSPAGKTSLSRAGDPATVSIERTVVQNNTLFIRVSDASPSPFGKINSSEWRAITQLNGAMSIASASGYGNIQLSGASGLRLLQSFVATLVKENPTTVSKKETTNPLNAVLRTLRR